MIMVHLDCEDMECFASEQVDVYHDNLTGGAQISGYVPEGWQIVQCAASGLALALCPKHAA